MPSNILRGLSPKAYTDKNFWTKENKTIFTKNWVFVGFAHELKNEGDVLPINVADQPILLIKESKNKINAFHNICSHRCLKLVDKEKNVGQIISCPYHAWSYDLKGNLVSSPHFGGTNNHQPKGFLRKKKWIKTCSYKYLARLDFY